MNRKLIILSLLLLSSCASLREEGYQAMTKDFLSRGDRWISEPVTIRLQVDIHIIPSYHFFKTSQRPEKSGEAWTDGTRYEVRILGRTDGQTIFVDPATLGHEVQHIINWKNNRLENPDRR